MKADATYVTLIIPDAVQVGDTVTIRGTARVVAIREEVVEVTSFADPKPRYASGMRTCDVLIDASVEW